MTENYSDWSLSSVTEVLLERIDLIGSNLKHSQFLLVRRWSSPDILCPDIGSAGHLHVQVGPMV